MPLNLNECTQNCTSCIRSYIGKHDLQKGDSFTISCKGIPKQYIPDDILASLGVNPEIAIASQDPVLWASMFLDWHCLDPDGEVWKRKSEDGTLGELPRYNEEQAKAGRSIFHRPYQAEMLRCSARHKVFRCGRQLGKTECLCISILFHLWNSEGFKIVVIAPYQSQIDLIFTRLTNLLRSSSLLSNSIERSVKAPNYQIILKNKSQATGFTAGSRSGGDAAAARGQTGNMLVFDEADYLSTSDVDACLAIVTNFPDHTVWMSSTPTGRRERFYDVCHSTTFREFHYPSQINPNWNDDLETLYREQLTEDGYKHEILGEFGEQEEGVYQYKYVAAAQSNYKYGDFAPGPNWNFMFGVDWNDVKIGTTIAIVGFNKHDGLFYLVDKYIVTRGQRTQLAACQKIADLNRLWRPDAIYVDEGFGTTQIEVLRDFGGRARAQHGAKHPDAALCEIVKPYNFSSNVQIRDLFSKQLVPKPAKPFLVENSVRRFENYSFKYPKEDEKYTAQLLGYIICRVSSLGRPQYEQQNDKCGGDHMIDAVNLALVGFTLEQSGFGKAKYDNKIAFSRGIGSALSPQAHREPYSESARATAPEGDRLGYLRPDQGILPKAPDEMPIASGKPPQLKLWSIPGWSSDRQDVESAKRHPRRDRSILTPRNSRQRPKRTKF